jgi:hypothetical protein
MLQQQREVLNVRRHGHVQQTLTSSRTSSCPSQRDSGQPPDEALAWNRPHDVHIGLDDPLVPHAPEPQVRQLLDAGNKSLGLQAEHSTARVRCHARVLVTLQRLLQTEYERIELYDPDVPVEAATRQPLPIEVTDNWWDIYGTVADWFAAIGTVGALVWAVMQYRGQLEDKRTEQASKITYGIVYSLHNQKLEKPHLVVENRSDQPVYKVLISPNDLESTMVKDRLQSGEEFAMQVAGKDAVPQIIIL